MLRLQALLEDDKRICPIADKYWNARGGSYSDGGAFIFDLVKDNKDKYRLECKDKFGIPVVATEKIESCDFTKNISDSRNKGQIEKIITEYACAGKYIFDFVRDSISQWSF